MSWLGEFLQDLRFGARMLLKRPGLAATVALTLALGIAVNASIFGFVSDFLLRPLPAKDPGRLVVVVQTSPHIAYQVPFSYEDIEDLRRMQAGEGALAQAFEGLAAYIERDVHLSRTGEASERAWIQAASDNLLGLLGARAQLGRLFLPGEGGRPGADSILVLTDAAWRSRFDADPGVIGQSVRLNGLPFTIVGVAEPGFVGATWGTAVVGFVPMPMLASLSGGDYVMRRGNTLAFVMGRLKAGASVRQAQAAMDAAMARLMAEHKGYYMAEARAKVIPERQTRPSPYISQFAPTILAALGALALLVLIIAAANAAGLLYAQAAAREHELAMRAALGATRGRMLRALLAESLLLAAVAGVAGLLGMLWLQPTLDAMLPTPASIAPAAAMGADWRPVAFGLALALLAGAAAGFGPALSASAQAPRPNPKATAEGTGLRRHRMRSLLVAAQVAVSCVVLVGAAMALRSVQNLLSTPLGFDPDGLVIASFDLDKQRYDANRGKRFEARLLEEARALPGVRSATLVDHAPFDTRIGSRGGVRPQGSPATTGEGPQLAVIAADRTFLETLGIPLIAGRPFGERDGFGAPLVAIVNQALAESFWPGESAVGKRISMQEGTVEVAGVIGGTFYDGIAAGRHPLLILPLAQNYRGGATLIVRTDAPAAAAGALRGVVARLDPDLPLLDVQTMRRQFADSPAGMMPFQLGAKVAAGQGAIALLLAALGVFGLISFNATRRTREIGVRMAMGATRADAARLICRDSAPMVLAGLAAGLLLALALSRLLSGLLYGVGPADPVVFTAAPAVVLAAATLAAWLPARRAAKVDPMTALRAE